MKALLFLLLPVLSFSQPQLEKTTVGIGGTGHVNAKFGGIALQKQWWYDNNGFGSIGVEYLFLEEATGFGSLNGHLGYLIGKGGLQPFLLGGFGAGLVIKHGYGAYAEGGMGIKLKLLQLSLLYRTGAFANCPVDLEGWYGKIGINF